MRFFADDGFSIATLKAAIEAAVRFGKDLFVNTGCMIEQMSVYSPGYDLARCPQIAWRRRRSSAFRWKWQGAWTLRCSTTASSPLER